MADSTFKKVINFLFVDEKDENDKYSRAGMMALFRKELADQVQSWRFLIVLLIIAITGVVSVYSAGQAIQSTVQSSATASAYGGSTFLTLFTSSGSSMPSFVWFLAFFGPIIGLILGFDAINGERSKRTLTRLVSQPIYRDAVIFGKFLSGLTVIAVMVFSLGLIFVSMGITLIGTPPSIDDILRILVFLVYTVVYMSIWLAIAILFSLLFRHSATSIMLGIAIWIFLSFFFGLIAQGIAGAVFPVTDSSTTQAQMNYVDAYMGISRISPTVLFSEAVPIVLDPSARTLMPYVTSSQGSQLQSAVVGPLPLDQSLLLVWPHLVVLVAILIVCFAISYVIFMRQEIRAGS